MILTNKFRAEYNYENIERDFDIYFVKGTTGLYNTNILDIPTAEYKALAVQHSFGKEALVLFQKGKEYNLNFSRKIKEQYPNVAVEKSMCWIRLKETGFSITMTDFLRNCL